MCCKEKLEPRKWLYLLAFFIIVPEIATYPYPYPHPYPHPHPYPLPYPAIDQPAPQQNVPQDYDQRFFKPPELEETIQEVQKILQRDPSLPRLTRGEIEELYEKVTREEYQKSVAAGDMGRADSMRALMLVLPYNTDNSTRESLQELYTRPPVTKVIESLRPHEPIKFVTADPNSVPKTETPIIGQLSATTYKPNINFRIIPGDPSPTTYHPPPPAPVMYKMTPSAPQSYFDFQPITNFPVNQFNVNNAENLKPVQRFSSHYNAKNAEFLKTPQIQLKGRRPYTTSTVQPVADVLESLGIVHHSNTRRRVPIDDYYPAESAPKPVIANYVPLQLENLRGSIIAPKIKADAYTSFKPLNIGEEVRVKPEVEDYLTRFGIVGGRKRKALKKNEREKSNSDIEQVVEPSEYNEATIKTNKSSKTKKNAPTNTDAELAKLLENLQELERLNANRKPSTPPITSTKQPSTTRPPTTSTTTTTTTTTESPNMPALITHGDPKLIEPKPHRRIDPNIDISYGAASNQLSVGTNNDQLTKLLENLQELERLRSSPQKVVKSASPSAIPARTTSRPLIPPTTPTPRTQAITNRFSELAAFQRQAIAQSQNEVQLQNLLKQLQGFEQVNARTTTSTTKQPGANLRDNAGDLDLFQLRKLLTDDNALEQLYEQARKRVTANTKPSTTTTTTTTTTTPPPITTTTKRSNELNDLEQLQKYLAELDRRQPTRTTTSTTTSTTTTTTTTTPKPTTSKPKKQPMDDEKLEELINRVQQLERMNDRNHLTAFAPTSRPTEQSTQVTSPFLGFTSRNVNEPQSRKATATDYRVPSNDFAQLQQLYRQVQEADQASFGRIEISTKSTVSKQGANLRTQNFAQRIIDITNDTGSGSSLQEVDPNDFVQLQKLLSKVKELERVRINAGSLTETPTQPNSKIKSQREITETPSLVTSESLQAPNVHHPNDATQIVYPTKSKKNDYNYFEEFTEDFNDDELKLESIAATPSTTKRPSISKAIPGVIPGDFTSSEELHELAYSKPINPKQSGGEPEKTYEQYHELFGNLADGERNGYREMYKNMEPPVIQKTATKAPPKFVATHKPQSADQRKAQLQIDLEELQKLLNNAQELRRLGVTLPKELSEQIENKLTKTNGSMDSTLVSKAQRDEENSAINNYASRYGSAIKKRKPAYSTTEQSDQNDSWERREKTVVFSVTTPKTAMSTETKSSTTESPVVKPVFSATKIIEAAIKRAATRIGVTTEHPQGFHRRNDLENEDAINVDTTADDNDDMVGEFSEVNYQIAVPDINGMAADSTEKALGSAAKPLTEPLQNTIKNDSQGLLEIQRLIGNLQELQRLNLSISSDLVKMADAKYLESLKKTQAAANETIKSRRQSATLTAETSTEASTKAGINTETERSAEADSTASEKTSTSLPSSSTPSLPSSIENNSASSPTRINLNLGTDESSSKNDETAANADDSTTTTTKSTTETTSTTEESRNGSIADLEDSFGPDPIKEEPLPPKKKNGFYFLADWNSFLEVGDGDDQVVVRFSPKVGDPRLFLPVKIP